MRFRVEPRDVPADVAARRLGLTRVRFDEVRDQLFAKGFPRPDDITGNYDLDAIDEWRKRRNPHLFGIAPVAVAVDASSVVASRLKQRKYV
jgi:hypothetical protein